MTLLPQAALASADNKHHNEHNESAYIINFNKADELQKWQSTNDNVMGGKSQGFLTFDTQYSVFQGVISLENNGGFSSVYRNIEPLSQGLNTIEIDVQGDGLTYQLRLAIFINGYRLAYKHDFTTVAGQRQTIKLSLADFKASFRGRIIRGAPTLKSEDIKHVGFLLTNKRKGPFSLSLYQLTINRSISID